MHPYRTLAALDDANEIWILAYDRHEVDDRDLTFVGDEERFEDERLAAVLAAYLFDRCDRRDEPASVILGTEQRGEAGGRVEARQA
jgi:hypothetical protein